MEQLRPTIILRLNRFPLREDRTHFRVKEIPSVKISRILNRPRPLLRSTDHLLILQAVTVPDGSVHISTPKPENGISGISPGMIFLPGSNSRQETMNIDRM